MTILLIGGACDGERVQPSVERRHGQRFEVVERLGTPPISFRPEPVSAEKIAYNRHVYEMVSLQYEGHQFFVAVPMGKTALSAIHHLIERYPAQ